MSHIKPTNDLAPRAILVGDPGRALALAQAHLDAPLMFNHHRGLWGYTGAAADGEPLTIQATGIGGPSAAAVLAELCDLGLQVALRAGTCRAVGDALPPGTLLAAGRCLAADGASRALGAGEQVRPDPDLLGALVAAGAREALAASADTYAAPLPAGPVARDLSTAAILQLAATRGVRAAAVLAVVDVTGADEALTERLGALAAGVLVEARTPCP